MSNARVTQYVLEVTSAAAHPRVTQYVEEVTYAARHPRVTQYVEEVTSFARHPRVTQYVLEITGVTRKIPVECGLVNLVQCPYSGSGTLDPTNASQMQAYNNWFGALPTDFYDLPLVGGQNITVTVTVTGGSGFILDVALIDHTGMVLLALGSQIGAVNTLTYAVPGGAGAQIANLQIASQGATPPDITTYTISITGCDSGTAGGSGFGNVAY